MRRKALINSSSDGLLLVDSSDSLQRSRRKPYALPLGALQSSVPPDLSISTDLGGIQMTGGYVRKVGVKAIYTWTVLAAIVYTFFVDDLRMAILPKATDVYIDVSLLLCVLLFSTDIFLRVLHAPGYLWSLYFFLDLLATVSIVGDVQLIVSATIPSCLNSTLRNQKEIGKAARLGGNCLRLLRVIRIKELEKSERIARMRNDDGSPLLQEGAGNAIVPQGDAVRILVTTPRRTSSNKMNRHSIDTSTHRRKSKKSGTLGRLYHMQVAPKTGLRRALRSTARESNISKRMASRVVTLVALTVLVISFVYSWVTDMNGMTFTETSFEFGLDLINNMQGTPRYMEIVNEYVRVNSDPTALDFIVKLTLPGNYSWGDISSDLRSTEVCSITCETAEVFVEYSNRVRLLGVFSICRTIVLCVIMTSIVILLNSDMTNLLVFPLERMMETVTSLAQNPQNMFKLQPKSFKELAESRRTCCCVEKDFAHGEIRVLENAFRKIGVMLALVYGSAGSEMITNSIRFEGEFTPMNRGKEILAIFCFAKVGHFDDLLEALGVSILKYVNQIAGLVHSQSEKYMGSVNRNLGDSFLLAWKFPDEDGIFIHKQFVVNAHSETVKQITSLALVFAVKTIAKVAKSEALIAYQRDEKVRKQMKGFSSKLTFGFHVGWAYEGPIGSYFKVDASYLSPNVNIASRVESATRLYDVYILTSEEFYLRLEANVQPFLRQIDCVTLKGVHEPIKLYCFDLCNVGLGFSQAKPTKRKIDCKRKKLKEAIESKGIYVHELFTQSDEIALMRRQFHSDFFSFFNEGLSLYASGNWHDAYSIFRDHCLPMRPLDGPTNALLLYMKEYDFTSPPGWAGVRELMYK